MEVIKKTILSEKAYKLMEKGLYTFLVDSRATKAQIAKAVNNQFAVEVKKVNVLNQSSKMKKIAKTRKTTEVGGGKKAIVYLKPGQKIAVLSPKSATGPERSRRTAKEPKNKRSMKDKDVEKVSVEGKEG